MEFAEYIPTPKVEGVWCYNGRQKAISGTLCLTGHHMILYADETNTGEIWILYKNIDAVEKRFGVDKGTLILRCKDLQQIQLTIPGVQDATDVAYTAEVLSSIAEPSLHYPYFYRPKFKFDEDGWLLYNIKEQFSKLSAQSDRWRLSKINADFSVCKSYPRSIIVPQTIDDSAIQKSARFRDGGRFPVLSYFHKNGAAIIRSSQPLVNTGNRRCKEDEKVINAMLGPSHRGYILDLRSVQTAVQAKSKGGGYETDHHYPRWKRIHMNLSSYSVHQESLIRIVEASNDKSGSMDRWLSKLESSGWMGFVKKSLDAACLVAQCVDREEWSVLVHESGGFDSTLTVTSLAQVILDPECRTVRGFLTLIDREWIYGGHPFNDRGSHGPYSNTKQRGEGPEFSIFLESVFQLLCQFPLSFEFTATLMLDLRMHSYSSHFGTFLFNNMQERLRGKLHQKTVSLWSYVLSPTMFGNYINPLYRRRNDVIWPSVAPHSLEFWEELFTPWCSPRNEALDRVRTFEAERLDLQTFRMKLSKHVADAEVAVSDSNNQRLTAPLVVNSMKNLAQEKHSILSKDDTAKNCKISSQQKSADETNGSENSQTVRLRSENNFPSSKEFLVPNTSDLTAHDLSDTGLLNGELQPNLMDDLMAFVEPAPSSPNRESSEDSSAIDDLNSGSPDATLIDFNDLLDLKVD